MTGLVVLGIVAVVYAVAAAKLDRVSVGAPIVFLLAGTALGSGVLGVLDLSPSSKPVELLTELTLALLLFADASTVSLAQLKSDVALPTRLLLIGLPLTIVLGTVLAHLIVPGSGWAVAGLIATILAPTDAALSIPVVSNPVVPVRIRRALNVESGLNDGIATPIVAVLIAVVAAEESTGQNWVANAAKAIGVALAVAAVAGLVGGLLVAWATRRRWMTALSQQLVVVTLAPLTYIAALEFGGNGFVACFAAGLLFGSATRHRLHAATEFTETTGLFLSFLVWALFGVTLVAPILSHQWHWAPVVYALLSLTLVRMLPVALALIGSHLRPVTVIFVGWFGPRGLASVVFLILALDDLHITQLTDPLVQTVVWTIVLSVLLHGLTSNPLARAYGQHISAVRPEPAELATYPEPRLRRRSLGHPSDVPRSQSTSPRTT